MRNDRITLEDWRQETGMSLDELAARLGLSRTTTWRLCRGEKVPNVILMEKIKALTARRVTEASVLASQQAAE